MIPIKYVCPLLVWSFVVHLVFNKLLPPHYDVAPKHLFTQALLFFMVFLPVDAFFGVISFFSRFLGVNEAKRHKIELLVGNGAAVLCPIVSTCFMRSLKLEENVMYFTQFMLLGSDLVFFYLPYLRSSHYHLPAPFQKIHKLFLVTHGAIIYFLVMKQKAHGICFMQVVMWILSFVGIHEFWNIFWSDLRVRRENMEPPVINNQINTIITMVFSPCPWNYEEDYEEEEEEPPVPEDPAQEAADDFPDDLEQEPDIQDDVQNEEEHNLDALHERLRNMVRNPPIFEQDATDCIVCTNGYSTTRFPIVLNCGHSICEECAETLLAIGDGFIYCPFCRSVTMVYGSVRELPRNYALMQRIG